jgi:tetratricopeptide (TPR) repeat protein
MMALYTSLRRGQRLLAQGNWADASETFRQGRDAHPAETRLALQHLRLLTERGEFEEGKQLALELRERFPDHAPSGLFAGKLFFAAKDFSSAADAFAACLALKPGNLLARDYLALAQWVGQEHSDALSQLLKGQLSHNVDFLCDFAESAERILREQGLKRDAGTVEKLNGETPKALVDEAASEDEETRLAESGWPEAVETPALFARLMPFTRRWREIRRRFGRAAKFYDRKEFAKVLAEMDALLAVAPDLALARSVHAEAQFYLGRFAEAGRELELLAQAAERKEYRKQLAETLPFIQSMRGYVLLRQGRFEEALALLEQVTPFGPDDFMGHYYRGICLQALDRWREGREQLRIAWGEYQFSTELGGLIRLLTELKLLGDADQSKRSADHCRPQENKGETPPDGNV